jgi:hypothetical protein
MLVTLFAFTAALARAQGREYDVKAAFLYNIVNLTTWPPEAFQTPSDPIRLCVIGGDPFGRTLERIIEGDTVGSRSVIVDHVRGDDVAQCSLLFVPRAAAARVPQMIHSTAARPVLTIGESPDFLKQGGMINFVIDSGRVRFDVNLAAVTARGLTVSSRLLRVARTTAGAGA